MHLHPHDLFTFAPEFGCCCVVVAMNLALTIMLLFFVTMRQTRASYLNLQLQGHRLCSADDGQWWQYVMTMQVFR
jgi:hypothetical protein